METKRYTVKLTAKETPARDVLILKFEKPEEFEFQAGQFVQFEAPVSGSETVLRLYSISSTPANTELEFCVKVFPDGVASQHFMNMRVGDEIALHGPRGMFVVAKQTPALFVATGVGIAPIMAMLADELTGKQTQAPLQLLFGVRSKEDVFWDDRLEALAKQYKNFSYHITLSQPSDAWTGLKGRVTAHLPGAVAGREYYICGSADMVKDVRGYLLARGVPLQYIHLEIF